MTWWHYLLLVNLYLVLFFGFYALFLRRETFFQLNRVYLVASALLSFIIPVIEADWVKNLFITQEVQHTIYNMPLAIPYTFVAAPQAGVTLGQVLTGLYISITLILLGRLMWQLFVLKKSIEKPEPSAAYTFFKKISLGENVAQSKIINQHEQVHAGQWHSVDVMIIETVLIINWFNPVVYLYRFAIKYIHEFIADSQVIQGGADKADYALLLLSQSFDVSANNLVNQFYNHSLLKQRIMMLQKNKSQRIALAKYGLSAPLFILMLILSSATINNSKAVAAITDKTQNALETPAADVVGAITDAAQIPAASKAEESQALVEQPFTSYEVTPVTTPAESKSINLQPDTDKVYAQVDRQPQFPGGLASFGQFLGNNIKYPKADRESGVTGKVMASFVIERDGTLSDVKAVRGPSQAMMDEAVRVVMRSPKWKPGSVAGKEVRVSYTVPIDFTIEPDSPQKQDSVYKKVDQVPVFPGGLEALGKFLGNNIKYPKADREKGTTGKVLVQFTVETDGNLSDIKALNGPSETMKAEATRVFMRSPRWKPGYQKGAPVRVSYVVPVAFTIEPDENDKPAGKKSAPIKKANASGYLIRKPAGTSPLYIIDGKVSDLNKPLETIKQEDIAKMDVWKGDEAINLYGSRGKNGVIVITTKNAAKVSQSSVNKRKNNYPNPIYIVDGKLVNVEIKNGKRVSPLATIAQDNIEVMEIMRDEDAVKRYGPAGKRGVILITTKNAEKASSANVTVKGYVARTKTDGKVSGITVANNKVMVTPATTAFLEQKATGHKITTATSPLYVIDGEIVKPDPEANGASPLAAIAQEDIAAIEILKDEPARALYGSAGKYGVIKITTKNAK